MALMMKNAFMWSAGLEILNKSKILFSLSLLNVYFWFVFIFVFIFDETIKDISIWDVLFSFLKKNSKKVSLFGVMWNWKILKVTIFSRLDQTKTDPSAIMKWEPHFHQTSLGNQQVLHQTDEAKMCKNTYYPPVDRVTSTVVKHHLGGELCVNLRGEFILWLFFYIVLTIQSVLDLKTMNHSARVVGTYMHLHQLPQVLTVVRVTANVKSQR